MNVKIIHPVLLKRGSEKLLLWLDDTFVHLEDFRKPVEVPEGCPGFQITGFQRQLDVHYLSVSTQHLPGGMHLHKYKPVIQNLHWKNKYTIEETKPTIFTILKHTDFSYVAGS